MPATASKRANEQPYDVAQALIAAGFLGAFIAPWFGIPAATVATAKTLLWGTAAIGGTLYVAGKWRIQDERQTWLDRDAGRYLIGRMRSGKTTLATLWFQDDIRRAHGCAWVTTHGARDIARLVPADRLTLISPPRTHGLNILTGGDPYNIANRVSTVCGRAFDLGDIQRQLLHTAALTIAEERPGATLWDVWRFCDDPNERREYVMASEVAQRAWADPDPKSLRGLVTRLGNMLNSPRLSRGLADPEAINLDDEVRAGRIVVLDIAQDDSADAEMLARSLVDMFQQVGLKRPRSAPSYPVYLDEFQGYTSPGIAVWLAEGGKRHMPLTLIHQMRAQLPDDLARIASSCGTVYCMAVNIHDAREMAAEIGVADPLKLPHLSTRTYYARVLQRGRAVHIGPRRVPFVGKKRAPRWLREIRRHTLHALGVLPRAPKRPESHRAG